MQTLQLNQLPPSTPPPPTSSPTIQEPTAPTQEATPATEYNISVDDFINENLSEAKPSADTIVNTDTGAPEINLPLPSARPELSAAEATAQTKRLMQARDMIQARLLAWVSKDMERWKEFKLEQWEFDMLCEAYADTFQRLGKIPAWLDIVLAEAVIMGPRIVNVLNNRKLAEENERLKEKIRSMNMEIPKPSRKDSKRFWEIDDTGKFTHDIAGKYLKINERKTKPKLTLENLEMLYKYNDPGLVKKVYNLE